MELRQGIFDDVQQNREYGEKKPDIPILATGRGAARGNYTAITLQ